MGMILFWLEAAVAGVLWSALGLSITSRQKSRPKRIILKIVLWLFAFAPWVVLLLGLALAQIFAGGALFPLVTGSIGLCIFVVGAEIVDRRAKCRQTPEDRPHAASWHVGKLALATAAAVLLTCMTFWNLDLAVRQEMGALRLEAGAIALAVSPPRVPDSQNAAPLYKQAFEMINTKSPPSQTQPADDHDTVGAQAANWLSPDKGEFNPDDPKLLAFLDSQKPLLDLLRKAGELPGCNFGTEYNPPSIASILPHLGKMRSLGRILCLSARVEAHHGNKVQAARDLSAAWALAEHSSSEPMLIGTLITMALNNLAFETFQYDLDQGGLDAQSMQSLKFSAIDFREALHRSMRMERAFGLSIFTNFDPSGMMEFMNAAGLPGPNEYMISDAAAPYRVFLWHEDLHAYEHRMRTYERLSTKPYYEVASEWREINETRGRMGGLLTNAFLPTFTRVSELSAQSEARVLLTRLGLAMWQYRLDHGSFPDDLRALVPAYLPTIPIDPFDGNGMKLSTAGGQLVIYSIGPDMKDDGGKPVPRISPQGITLKGDIVLRLSGMPTTKEATATGSGQPATGTTTASSP